MFCSLFLWIKISRALTPLGLRCLFLHLEDAKVLGITILYDGVEVLLVVAAEGGLHGHTGLVALKLAVFLLLDVSIQVLDKEVLTQFAVALC